MHTVREGGYILYRPIHTFTLVCGVAATLICEGFSPCQMTYMYVNRLHVVENLKARLPVRVASTIDFWSRLDRKGFGTVTVQWITSDWSLEEAVLGAKSLDCVIGVHDEDHERWEVPREEAANVAQFYIGLLEEFISRNGPYIGGHLALN